MSPFLYIKDTKSMFLSYLFSLIPISFIIGNLVLNINIAILIIFTFSFYFKEITKIKIFFTDKILIAFFIFLIFSSILNTYVYNNKSSTNDFAVLIKTIGYLRYLLLYFAIRFLVENKLLHLKIFFFTSSLCVLFVSLDLFYQLKFGKDIFGHPIIHRKLSGPFGDELIAGSYLQRFSLFLIFTLPLFFNIKNKIFYFFCLILFFSLSFGGIIVSGNRMPLLLFLFGIILIILFEKKFRKYALPFAIISTIIFISIYKSNSQIKTNFTVLANKLAKLALVLKPGEIEETNMPSHYKEFVSFHKIWLENRYIGGGIKSFYKNCVKINWGKKHCSTHPHNYYLEILTETGLIGCVLLIVLFFNILYRTFASKYFTNTTSFENKIITPFAFLFLLEVFPLKSSGSFFTTGNATFIFLIMAITVALSAKKN